MKWLDRFAERLFSSPLLWGGTASFIFHVLLERSQVKMPPWLLQRLTGQWESYVCTTMFLIALAFLVRRCIGLAIQIAAWQRFEHESLAAEGAIPLAKRLDALEKHVWVKKSLLYRRLQEARQFCQRQDTTAPLATHLKELSDADYDRLQTQYGLMRILIWAIPSCGSVATILAIASVVEKLPSDTSGDVLTGAAAGLSGAFNLFAFSVGLAIILVVLKFAVEQAEQLMLAAIDRQVNLATAAESGGRTAQPALQADQFRQLTDLLKSVALSLTQQSQNGSRIAGIVPSTGAQIKEIEAVVQTAVATALQRQPAINMAGEPATMDSTGWKTLQHVLQKLAHVLEQQNAKLETEGRVSKHLTTIIDEGLKDAPPSLRIHEGRQTTLVSPQF